MTLPIGRCALIRQNLFEKWHRRGCTGGVGEVEELAVVHNGLSRFLRLIGRNRGGGVQKPWRRRKTSS